MPSSLELPGTEESPGAAARLAETGWDLRSLCTQDFHLNKNRPESMRGESLRRMLKPEVLARLLEMLEPDRRVYECAIAQHKRQTESYGARFTDAFDFFTSDEFQARCRAEFKAAKKRAPNKAERSRMKEAGNRQDAIPGPGECVVEKRYDGWLGGK